ncbi:MAG: glycogen synthase [Candidatus Nanopelagicales bacterium]
MHIAMLTREWPPDIYGGAGVHVEQLVSRLRALADVEVHCFGAPRPDARAQEVPPYLNDANPALQTLGVDLGMVATIDPTSDVVHSHTWYTNLAGHLTSLQLGIPHIVTAQSLEPLRPWKREQLGGGYEISSWVERTSYRASDALIAVSNGMRADILSVYPDIEPTRVHVVHNGIDTDVYRPVADASALDRFGIDRSRPYALFVGRITRQKGLLHLVRAARYFDEGATVVLCASSPDTVEIAEETAAAVDALRAERRPGSVIWIQEPVDQPSLIQLLTHARVFTCPSIYEPLGIVNLEAMACSTAVVASAVGGIPEVVDDHVTGLLVPCREDDQTGFEAAFAAAVNELLMDESRADSFGAQGRQRAIDHFSWTAIAEQTMNVYRWALDNRREQRR